MASKAVPDEEVKVPVERIAGGDPYPECCPFTIECVLFDTVSTSTLI
jgi:hypothetical protein